MRQALRAGAREFIPVRAEGSVQPLRFSYRNALDSVSTHPADEARDDHLDDVRSVGSESSAEGHSTVTTNSLADSLLTQSSFEERGDEFFERPGGAEPASTERRLEQRQKQIDYGKVRPRRARWSWGVVLPAGLTHPPPPPSIRLEPPPSAPRPLAHDRTPLAMRATWT
jgi:hypothetical protein